MYRGRLYLVVNNDATGLELWRTWDGVAWEQVGNPGFGNSHNEGSYWDNAMAVFKDRLYIAAYNFDTGGEVWQIEQPFTLFMPLVVKP